MFMRPRSSYSGLVAAPIATSAQTIDGKRSSSLTPPVVMDSHKAAALNASEALNNTGISRKATVMRSAKFIANDDLESVLNDPSMAAVPIWPSLEHILDVFAFLRDTPVLHPLPSQASDSEIEPLSWSNDGFCHARVAAQQLMLLRAGIARFSSPAQHANRSPTSSVSVKSSISDTDSLADADSIISTISSSDSIGLELPANVFALPEANSPHDGPPIVSILSRRLAAWSFHVALIVRYPVASHYVYLVLDPVLNYNAPMTLASWLDAQHNVARIAIASPVAVAPNNTTLAAMTRRSIAKMDATVARYLHARISLSHIDLDSIPTLPDAHADDSQTLLRQLLHVDRESARARRDLHARKLAHLDIFATATQLSELYADTPEHLRLAAYHALLHIAHEEAAMATTMLKSVCKGMLADGFLLARRWDEDHAAYAFTFDRFV